MGRAGTKGRVKPTLHCALPTKPKTQQQTMPRQPGEERSTSVQPLCRELLLGISASHVAKSHWHFESPFHTHMQIVVVEKFNFVRDSKVSSWSSNSQGWHQIVHFCTTSHLSTVHPGKQLVPPALKGERWQKHSPPLLQLHFSKFLFLFFLFFWWEWTRGKGEEI